MEKVTKTAPKKAKKQRKQVNKLTCLLTKQTRQSNANYIGKKAGEAQTTPDDFKAHYVTKTALQNLKEMLEALPISEVKEQTGLETIQLVKALRYNGRGVELDDYKPTDLITTNEIADKAADAHEATDAPESTDAFVPFKAPTLVSA